MSPWLLLHFHSSKQKAPSHRLWAACRWLDMTKAKCRVPAISSSRKLTVTFSSASKANQKSRPGGIREWGWLGPPESCRLLLPVGQAYFSSGCTQWGWGFFNPLRKAMLARVPAKLGSSTAGPGSMGWAVLAVKAGGRTWWLDRGPSTTPRCSELVGSRDGGASPKGASMLLPLHG